MKKVLITGSSSGLGLSLCDIFLNEGYEVYGISKSPTPRKMQSCVLDLSNKEKVREVIPNFISSCGVKEFDYVFLNAGVLGPIDKAVDVPLHKIEESFQISVGSSKQILDFLYNSSINIKNVIGISSGAANRPYDGWLSYCITKAAFKQMISCYALENTGTHFVSLSPGPVKTKMQESILKKDATKFKSLQKFHDMYHSLDSPSVVSQKIFKELPSINTIESGSFFAIK